MANQIREQVALNGEEKRYFLKILDKNLATLSYSLSLGMNEKQLENLKEFGVNEKWDWTRIPDQSETYSELSGMVDLVRQNYNLFDIITDNQKLENNRGFFEDIHVSTLSGLPWVFDIIRLNKLKSESENSLAKIKTYQESSKDLYELVTQDYSQTSEVLEKAKKIWRESMNRGLIEKIRESEIISTNSETLKPKVTKILPMGGEDFWRIKTARYSPYSNMFETYVVDLWQDLREKQITEEKGEIKVSKELLETFKFGMQNAAWFVLKEVDERFKSIHPVHISRGLIGPFENKYRTRREDPLQVAEEILNKDPDFAMLRFKRQYSYAPNHESVGDEIKQIIPRHDWNDEILICPQEYASKISGSVLGTNVRVVAL